MYLRAKVKPVSFRSTMRTLPKAPFPTTRSNRKWLRFTAHGLISVSSEEFWKFWSEVLEAQSGCSEAGGAFLS
jgi:hypothetical protein